jgi:hypothetical protein
MQPASSGVKERRRINSQVRSKTFDILRSLKAKASA